MAFDPSKKEEWIEVLNKSLEFQNKDFRQNSTSMQIIKAIAKWLETQPYEGVFTAKTTRFR